MLAREGEEEEQSGGTARQDDSPYFPWIFWSNIHEYDEAEIN